MKTNQKETIQTRTLCRIVKVLGGIEAWYRIEETGDYQIEFIQRRAAVKVS